MKVEGNFLLDFACEDGIGLERFGRFEKDHIVLSNLFAATVHVNGDIFVDGLGGLKREFGRGLFHEVSYKFSRLNCI